MSVDVGVDNGSEAWSASGSCSTMTSAVASIVHQANLPVTPRPAPDVDAAVPPEGKEVAFASDQYGDDFEIYTANVFTCEVQRVTDNAMDDHNPAWPTYGKNITYEAEYPRSRVRIGKSWASGYSGACALAATSCVDRLFSPPK
jgi:Tol biopolymer transport system component